MPLEPGNNTTTMETVIHSLDYSLNFLADLIADVGADDLTHQPVGHTNHPAWTIGHLTYIFDLIGSVIGIESSLQPEWKRLFGSGSQPINDPEIYPSIDESRAFLRDRVDRLIDKLRTTNDADFDQEFPDKDYLAVFPTVRHALTQVLVGHTAFHVGQVAAWRKAMGLPSIKRSYE